VTVRFSLLRFTPSPLFTLLFFLYASFPFFGFSIRWYTLLFPPGFFSRDPIMRSKMFEVWSLFTSLFFFERFYTVFPATRLCSVCGQSVFLFFRDFLFVPSVPTTCGRIFPNLFFDFPSMTILPFISLFSASCTPFSFFLILTTRCFAVGWFAIRVFFRRLYPLPRSRCFLYENLAFSPRSKLNCPFFSVIVCTFASPSSPW